MDDDLKSKALNYIYSRMFMCHEESDRSRMINETRTAVQRSDYEKNWITELYTHLNYINGFEFKKIEIIKDQFKLQEEFGKFLFDILKKSHLDDTGDQLQLIAINEHTFLTNIFVSLNDTERSVVRTTENSVAEVWPWRIVEATNVNEHWEKNLFYMPAEFKSWLNYGKTNKLEYKRQTDVFIKELYSSATILGRIILKTGENFDTDNTEILAKNLKLIFRNYNIFSFSNDIPLQPKPSRYVTFLTSPIIDFEKSTLFDFERSDELIKFILDNDRLGRAKIFYRKSAVTPGDLYMPYSIKFYEDIDIMFNFHFVPSTRKIDEEDNKKIYENNIIYKKKNKKSFLLETNSSINFTILHSYFEIVKIFLRSDIRFFRRGSLLFVQMNDTSAIVFHCEPIENLLFETYDIRTFKSTDLDRDDESIDKKIKMFILELKRIKIKIKIKFYKDCNLKSKIRNIFAIILEIPTIYNTDKYHQWTLFPYYFRRRLADGIFPVDPSDVSFLDETEAAVGTSVVEEGNASSTTNSLPVSTMLVDSCRVVTSILDDGDFV